MTNPHPWSVLFLDTSAFVKQIFAIHNYHADVISKEEFKCLTKAAISKWEDALELQNLIEGGASLTGRPSPLWRLLDRRLKDAKQMLGEMHGGEGCNWGKDHK